MDLNPTNFLGLDTLEPTWWVMDREPGMDDIAEQAGSAVLDAIKDLGVHPFQDTDKNDRLFLARFEFPKYDEDFKFPEALIGENVQGWVDFLGGFPIDDCEMLIAIGEISSSEPEKDSVKEGGGATAPVPDFFDWPDESKIIMNLTALSQENCKVLAKNLPGEPKPKKVHWWCRFNFVEGDGKKFPVPGEFLGLGVRMMPDKPWGKQLSSPFLYSGNWMDTVFYTSGVIEEIEDPTDERPFPLYKVRWRKTDDYDDGIVDAIPSDFATYQVGDRVTILKDVDTEKTSQLWKDDDMREWGENWLIAPITFYGLGYEED